MNLFTERALRIIQGIPAGHVMTYGQVAAAAGSPRGARQVVRVLHSMSAKYELPWHRIINVQGAISAPANAESKGFHQRELLEMEGIEFNEDGRVDLTMYRWFPLDTEEG